MPVTSTVVSSVDWTTTPAAVWRRHRSGLRAIRRLDPVQWEALTGIERQQQALARNTERFLLASLQQRPALGLTGHGKIFADQGSAESLQ